MSKRLDIFISVCVAVVLGTSGFYSGIYYGFMKSEEYVEILLDDFEKISEDVDAFKKVSDPKTIRLYVKELNKILDDINFLNNLVKSGQLADKSLSVYGNKISDVDDRMLLLRSEMYEELESLKLSITVKTDDKVYGLKEDVVTGRKAVLSKLDGINRQLEALEDMTNELSTDIDVIKNSKYAKKIWIKDKDE